jgi:hypothetical protein
MKVCVVCGTPWPWRSQPNVGDFLREHWDHRPTHPVLCRNSPGVEHKDQEPWIDRDGARHDWPTIPALGPVRIQVARPQVPEWEGGDDGDSRP